MDGLTDAQKRVVFLVACGLGNAQIARSLLIREGTVRNHLRSIFSRTGAQSRFELMAMAFAFRWVDPCLVMENIRPRAAAVAAVNRELEGCS